MKRWKLAISLAVIGAIVTPLVAGTYKMRPMGEVLVPYRGDEKERAAAYLGGNCRASQSPASHLDEYFCRQTTRELEAGGKFYAALDTPKYLVLNMLASVGGFIAIFWLTFLLPAIFAVASLGFDAIGDGCMTRRV